MQRVPGPCSRHRITFSESDVLEMRRAVRSGTTKRMVLSKEKGITPQHLRNILLGVSYPEVPEALTEKELRPPGVFTDEDVAYWRKRARRKRVSFTMIARKHKTQVSAVTRMLTGATYAHLPDAVPAKLLERPLFRDGQVIRHRKAFRACETTIAEIARAHDVVANTVVFMLTGRTYPHLPGALSEQEMVDRRREFLVSDVVAIREAYATTEILVRDIVAERKVAPATIRALLTGRTYADLPGAIPLKATEPKANAKLTNAGALELRRRFVREYPRLSLKALAVELDMSEASVLRVLKGDSYEDVPEAVPPECFHYAHRSLEPEVALFMRLTYHPEKVSCQKIATAFDLNVETVHRLLTGKTYKNIPGALSKSEMRPVGTLRQMSEETVYRARRQFRTRWVTMKTLAQEAGVTVRSMDRALRGYTYKNVPDAVPDHIKPLKAARLHLKVRRARSRRQTQPANATPLAA